MPTCGFSYFEINKLISRNCNSGSSDTLLQEKTRSVFNLQLPTLFVVISTHMQRGIKTGVKPGSQRRILPPQNEALTPRLEAQHRRVNAAQDVGQTFPGHYGHCHRTAVHILVGKTLFMFFGHLHLSGGQQNSL